MFDDETKVRFYRLISGGHPDCCWEWQGGDDHKGYGHFRANGRNRMAHHIAWEIRFGPIPKGLILRHCCDNPPCCNPDHLIPGTHRDNTEDIFLRGRTRYGKPPEMPPHVTDAMAAVIRANTGGLTARELSLRLGISRRDVWQVRRIHPCQTTRHHPRRSGIEPDGAYSRETKARFYQNIQGSHPDDCWIWAGSARCTGPHGDYGGFRVGRRVLLAHRVAWEIHYGPVPAGLKVLHQCDNPPCCNIYHLFLGTMKENCLDRSAKGHHNRVGNRRALTPDQIAAVQASPKTISDSRLARKFGVDRQVVTRARRLIV